MSEPTPIPQPSSSDGEFLKILLVGMDKRADRIEERLGGIEGMQSEILRLQIGQVRDIAAHTNAPLSAAHADAREPKTQTIEVNGDARIDARTRASIKRIVIDFLWENKKAAIWAITLVGGAGTGGYAIQGCNGKTVTIGPVAAPTATSAPMRSTDGRGERHRRYANRPTLGPS